MPVLRPPARFVLLALTMLLVAPAATVTASPRMPVGFYDDPNFRWAPNRATMLASAAATGATIIHTNANWPSIAPKRPKNPANQTDPAYRLNDLDELVQNASKNGMRVMIDITGSPKWANGNKTPNHMPKKLSDLTAFSKMLANRYDGTVAGRGYVGLWSVWNEPNLNRFLTPQYVGKKIVSPGNYAKLYRAAYAGIKAGNPKAQVAIGETSARGRDIPKAGNSATVAPGTFARLVAKTKGLKFDAWAHHPYPTSPNLPPTQKVRWPNVTLLQLSRFETSIDQWFHRRGIPVWITEYGHETKPGEPHGVTNAVQANYAKQSLALARKDKRVGMFIWFTLRDTSGNPWQSGLYSKSGAKKPAYAAFSSVARLIDGDGTTNVKAGLTPSVKVYVPGLAYFTPTGQTLTLTYSVKNGTRSVSVSSPFTSARLGLDQSVVFKPAFKPAKGKTYTVTAQIKDPSGHTVSRTVQLNAT